MGTGKITSQKKLIQDVVLLLLFVVVATISALINSSGNITYIFSLYFWVVSIYIISAYITAQSSNEKLIIQALIIGSSIAASVAILQSFLDIFTHIGRPAPARSIGSIVIPVGRSAGPYGTYGDYGMLLLASYAIVLFSRLESSRQSVIPSKKSANMLVVLHIVGIFVSQTRGTWIATIVVTVACCLLFGYRRNRLQKIRSYLIILTFPAIFFIIYSGRILFKINVDTVLIRLKVYRVAVNVFLSNSVYGVGYQNFISAAGDYGSLTAVHNMFLEVLVTTGIIGTMIFSMFIFGLASRLSKLFYYSLHSNPAYAVIPISVLGVLIQAQVVQAVYSYELWLIMGVSSGIFFSRFKTHS
ncbi:O-antigen ligase family protein [Halorubrum ezzemoulense]|uniref:O-antigen ligase family protein n=1 Tax=Halorubrum ezzemoulense TaxID=337243 RepID=UPI001C52CE43|nr:O-antigen ligase family protein [Halorubrum ezzemoulense]